MGKIYGVHDSYCALVMPSRVRPGEAKHCTCDSGKKAAVEIKEVEEWEAGARNYAGDMLGALIERHGPGAPMSPEQKERAYDFFERVWKEAHPRIAVVAATPDAPAVPAERLELGDTPSGTGDGPGEEDGPWAEGWPERAGLAGTAAKSLNEIGKLDAGKPKVFQFFMQQFPLGMQQLALHMERGCSDPGHVFLGWQGVESGYERYSDAMVRHTLEEIIATVTDIDREEGVDKGHIEERQAIAVAANALIRLELLLRKRRSLNLDARGEA